MPLAHRPVWPVKVSLPLDIRGDWDKVEEGSFVPHREVPMAENKVKGNKAGQAKPTKMNAVRQAVKKLGKDAKAADIQKFVQNTFGLAMTVNHVYNCLSELRKQAKKKRLAKSQEKKGAASAPAPAVAPPRQPTGKGGVSLEDMAVTKGLLKRVGHDRLHALIDVLVQ